MRSQHSIYLGKSVGTLPPVKLTLCNGRSVFGKERKSPLGGKGSLDGVEGGIRVCGITAHGEASGADVTDVRASYKILVPMAGVWSNICCQVHLPWGPCALCISSTSQICLLVPVLVGDGVGHPLHSPPSLR